MTALVTALSGHHVKVQLQGATSGHSCDGVQLQDTHVTENKVQDTQILGWQRVGVPGYAWSGYPDVFDVLRCLKVQECVSRTSIQDLSVHQSGRTGCD